MEDLFNFIDQLIIKIDEYNVEKDDNFKFLENFFEEHKPINIETLLNGERARLLTVLIICQQPSLDANEIYEVLSKNEDSLLIMNEKHLNSISALINEKLDKNIVGTIFSLFDDKRLNLYVDIYDLYNKYNIDDYSLAINVVINIMIEDIEKYKEYLSLINEIFDKDTNERKSKKVIDMCLKANFKVNDLIEVFNKARAYYMSLVKEIKNIEKKKNKLRNSYSELRKYIEYSVSRGEIIRYNDNIFSKITDEEIRKIILQYIYLYNKDIYLETNNKYNQLAKNSVLNYKVLLSKYKINLSEESIEQIISRHSIDKLEEILKILSDNCFEMNDIAIILQISELETIKEIIALLAIGYINKNLLVKNLNLFNIDSSVYKNFISIINMIKQNQINPYYFSNCQDIYLIDINLLNDNINILNEYKLFGNMKAGEDYKFFNNVNLRESIEIIFNLGLGNYLKDLTILNYADKFNRLRILKMLNISIESREQLISILTTNKFFVPDEMIPKYVDIHNKSKSLK